MVTLRDAGQGFGQRRHFVEMGGEQGPAAGLVVKRLDGGPGDGEAIEGGGAAADFIEDDRASGRWRG